jgi:hypothetical protein
LDLEQPCQSNTAFHYQGRLRSILFADREVSRLFNKNEDWTFLKSTIYNLSIIWYVEMRRRMAKVQCFTIDGMELWFFSHDHTPPHFHAKRRGQWEVRVNFLASSTSQMFEVVRPRGKAIPNRDIQILQEKVNNYREALLKEWEKKVNTQ